MTRVIKFRAWHKVERRMFEVTGILWSAASSEHLCRLELLSMDGLHTVRTVTGEETVQNNYELLEWTGERLSGKDVYEGDILGLENSEDRSRAVIVFVNGTFKAKLLGHRQSHYDKFWNASDSDWIVVGSIHEYPEMAKVRRK